MNAADLANMPAFPVPELLTHNGGSIPAMHQGVTLRQHYAGKLMAAMVANSETMKAVMSVAERSGNTIEEMVALGAVKLADALIAELARPVTP